MVTFSQSYLFTSNFINVKHTISLEQLLESIRVTNPKYVIVTRVDNGDHKTYRYVFLTQSILLAIDHNPKISRANSLDEVFVMHEYTSKKVISGIIDFEQNKALVNLSDVPTDEKDFIILVKNNQIVGIVDLHLNNKLDSKYSLLLQGGLKFEYDPSNPKMQDFTSVDDHSCSFLY